MRQRFATTSQRQDGWASARTSNVRRYFGKMIDFLLAPEPILDGLANGREATYIANKEIESQLHEMLEHDQPQLWQLVGYKGTGKSSVIKGCFKLWNESSVCRISANTIFIYCSFNSTDVHPESDHSNDNHSISLVLEGVIGAALRTLRTEHIKRKGPEITRKMFHKFVLNTKADILSRFVVDQDGVDEIDGELKAWEKGNRLTYRAVQLKYEVSLLPKMEDSSDANSDPSLLKRQIVLILDDLEGIAKASNRRDLVERLQSVWYCLRNGVDYPAKILIAHRPHTRDEFMRNGVWTPITIDFSTKLTLSKLIQYRTDQYVKFTNAGKEMSTRPTWEDSYRALWSLLTKYGERQNQEIILSLANYCFRDSLYRLTNILQHVAMEGRLSETDKGSFTLANASTIPNLSRAELLDLMGRRGFYIFTSNQQDGLVNLFENESDDPATDLMLALLIHWCWHQSKKYSAAWPRLVDLSVFKKLMQKAFIAHPHLDRIDWAISKALSLGLIDEVLDQYDTSKVVYHLMPRAGLLYEELANNSTLISLFYQEVYMEDGFLSNFRADRRLPFFHAIRYCGLVADAERQLGEQCVDKHLFWNEIFHKHLISEQVVHGLSGTWTRWLGDRPLGGEIELETLSTAIRTNRHFYEEN